MAHGPRMQSPNRKQHSQASSQEQNKGNMKNIETYPSEQALHRVL